MRLGVLFSGGKDSAFACWKAMQKEEVVCLITIVSRNPESYMFHTPNIRFAALQARSAGLPPFRTGTFRDRGRCDRGDPLGLPGNASPAGLL